jgi:acyl carrier protein
MTITEIEQGVKEVIAQNSRYAVDEISKTDPIDKFISSFMADRLARELKREFLKIDDTLLTNELFTTLKKISDLIDFIDSYY